MKNYNLTLYDEHNLIRFRIFSRFRHRIVHQVFISYISNHDPEVENAENVISGCYCTCQSGARTLGTCAHVAEIQVSWIQSSSAKRKVSRWKFIKYNRRCSESSKSREL